MEKITYQCECCQQDYEIQNGIIAEIKDGQIITDLCTPFTKLVQLCNDCSEHFLDDKKIIK